MVYEVPGGDAKGYGAPYRDLPANSGPSVEPFAYMGTGIPPHFLKDLREKPLWKSIDSARRYLRESRNGDQEDATARRLRSVVVFGEQDPLGRGYKEALLCVIGKKNMAEWALDGIMLENAGHYPMEDKPEDVAQLITRFA
ncbi:hypothetical protein PoHVEF18_010682 [Penicillium ochrochloron]